MARNEATLTFVGDSARLERTFARVGAGVRKLKDDVNSSASKIDILGKRKGLVSQLGKLPSMVGDAFSQLPTQVQLPVAAAGAAVAALFAAPLAAGITAAVLLAVGGGVLAAGIAAAAKDPRVKAAWGKVAESARGAFDKLGTHFVGPMERAAGAFKTQVDALGPMADRLGSVFGPVIDKLAPAIAQMAGRILPSLEVAAIASVPLFETLAEKAPAIADSIAKFFNMIASNGPTADLFFGRLLDGIVRLIDFITLLMDKLTKLYALGEDGWARWKRGVEVFGAAFDGLWSSFKVNMNRIINAWNRLSFTIGGGTIFGQDIPRFTLSTPDIPTFHKGGVMPGAPGTEGLALLQAGEKVIPANAGSGATVVIQAGGSGLDRMFLQWLQGLLRENNLALVKR